MFLCMSYFFCPSQIKAACCEAFSQLILQLDHLTQSLYANLSFSHAVAELWNKLLTHINKASSLQVAAVQEIPQG